MKLRHLIRDRAASPGKAIALPPPGLVPEFNHRTPATLATLATDREGSRRSVATVATVAGVGRPDSWPSLMRGMTVAGVQLDAAAILLESLMAAGTIDAAL